MQGNPLFNILCGQTVAREAMEAPKQAALLAASVCIVDSFVIYPTPLLAQAISPSTYSKPRANLTNVKCYT
jgi:hypothetical protein